MCRNSYPYRLFDRHIRGGQIPRIHTSAASVAERSQPMLLQARRAPGEPDRPTLSVPCHLPAMLSASLVRQANCRLQKNAGDKNVLFMDRSNTQSGNGCRSASHYAAARADGRLPTGQPGSPTADSAISRRPNPNRDLREAWSITRESHRKTARHARPDGAHFPYHQRSADVFA